jgi:hypothetical protein
MYVAGMYVCVYAERGAAIVACLCRSAAEYVNASSTAIGSTRTNGAPISHKAASAKQSTACAAYRAYAQATIEATT